MLNILFILPALVAGGSMPWAVGQPVQTTSGAAKGFASSYATDVSEYRGIRFGEDTAGLNRFMAPKRFNSNGNIDATSFV
jgi:cholinesterase